MAGIKSKATTGTRTRSSPSLLCRTQQKAPEFPIDGLCSARGEAQGGWAEGGREAKVVKQRLPKKIPSTRSLFRGESSQRLRIFPRKPLLCPSVNEDGTKEGREKTGKKRTSWEQGEEVTKEGIKRGLGSAFKFRGPHWSAESGPLRGRPRAPRVRARTQSCGSLGLGLGARWRVQSVSSVRPGDCRRLHRRPPAPASLTLCSGLPSLVSF